MSRYRASRHRGRGGSETDGPAHGAGGERWTVSYLDMVTVLMVTFIVLFAMSTVSAAKFEQLKNSLQTGFGTVRSQKIDTAKGVVVPPKDVNNPKADKPSPIALARIELQNLQQLKAAIDERLAAKGLASDVSSTIDQRGLTIGLISSQTFFPTNLAVLTPTAKEIITTIAPIIKGIPNKISLEGYADTRPPRPPYPSNWELAAARAVSVLHEMNASGGIAGSRLDAVSYGDTRTTAGETLSDERRVNVVVLSDAPGDVRDLIPKVMEMESSEGAAHNG